MDAESLKDLQAPLKARYRDDPGSALVTLRADGELDGTGIACRVRTATALAEAGLHPATGGDGTQLCSGDMLLEALVACAGVTLRAVATALSIPVSGRVHVEGDLDFRGTLGVDKEAPVGFRDIRLTFTLTTDADAEQIATLITLTERYCVVLQTLRSGPGTEVSVAVNGSAPS
ncbi:OsmC family protein [Pseudonocardia hispaniensis]|uniref:OsmC family protein n=1 Tax=Pseudonocardia hispaniensis TaxID=904933 RepID=A0ABW1J632_9PSEU